MTYDPTLPTTVDRIRLMLADTSNDVTTELFPDATYMAALAMYTNWKRAAADMAEAAAVKIEQDPSSVNFPGDIATSWSDRTRSLRARAASLRKEADDEDVADDGGMFGPVVTVRSSFLTGSGTTGGDLW